MNREQWLGECIRQLRPDFQQVGSSLPEKIRASCSWPSKSGLANKKRRIGDPSGIDMTRDIQERLEMFGSTAVIHRIALVYDQIEQYNPPPNPAKTTDARYQSYADKYGDESWELDALEPSVIVSLIREAVEARIDHDTWEEALSRQQTGRDQLGKVSRRWDSVVQYLGNGDGKA